MDLVAGKALKVTEGPLAGLYRLVLVEPRIERVAVVRLDPPAAADGHRSRGGRRKLAETKRPRKKPRPPLATEILWWTLRDVQLMDSILQDIDIKPPFRSPRPGKATEDYKLRCAAMARLLLEQDRRELILAHRATGGIVRECCTETGRSESFVRTCLSLLFRFGFHEHSLITHVGRCGAPGVRRPCDPGGRKKAGRKTNKQRVNKVGNEYPPPEQPGISSDWTDRILAADKAIPRPKPDMPQRIIIIRDSKFVRRYKDENGLLVPDALVQGEYPNDAQIERVLTERNEYLERLKQKTTPGHFERAMRGSIGMSWLGVSGPGHTYAIDSTVGDIYLRSRVNRAWIVGRPIVYLLVDVWSTAIVGFHACLSGPAWADAKVSLFNAAGPAELIAELWGYSVTYLLDPAPTLPFVLMCDRGEYLSRGARFFGAKLIPCLSYAPPYRPDAKGLVEVLHRIKKDKAYLFVPGAIDARRAELELRRFDPAKAVLTLSDFVAWLAIQIELYNTSADRRHRVDAHMIGAGVEPTPAGLWSFGHAAGIGVRRHHGLDDLVRECLPMETAWVGRGGVNFAGLIYSSDEAERRKWTTIARNRGGWEAQIHRHPGSVRRIWTPRPETSEFMPLDISDQSRASPELCMDEVLDSFAVGTLDNAGREHRRTQRQQAAYQKAQALIEKAKRLTAFADENYLGPKPTMSEARALDEAVPAVDAPPSAAGDRSPVAAAIDLHNEMVQAVIAAASSGMDDDVA